MLDPALHEELQGDLATSALAGVGPRPARYRLHQGPAAVCASGLAELAAILAQRGRGNDGSPGARLVKGKSDLRSVAETAVVPQRGAVEPARRDVRLAAREGTVLRF